MNEHDHPRSEWRRLLRIACNLIDQVNEGSTIIGHWTLGGGTAMMLQIHHRESHDIDIFLHDAQVLPHLNPSVADLTFEVAPSDYKGDGTRFAKFSFDGIGEIDFIVAPELTDNPTLLRAVEGVEISLETVEEIIAKKVVFRGESITPRDIFDIAASGRDFGNEVAGALARYPEHVANALATLEKLNPEFVQNAVSQLMILDEYKELSASSLGDTKQLLRRALVLPSAIRT